MFEEIWWQWGLIVLAVVVLLGIKAFTLNKKYNSQLENFVHPDIFVKDVKAKVTSPEQATEILAINIKITPLGHERLRNISILVAILNDFKKPPKMNKEIKNALKSTEGLSTASLKYRDYILGETASWE